MSEKRETKFRGISTCYVWDTDTKPGDMVFRQLVFQCDLPFIVGPVVEERGILLTFRTGNPVNGLLATHQNRRTNVNTCGNKAGDIRGSRRDVRRGGY